jgi:hypothetical protein
MESLPKKIVEKEEFKENQISLIRVVKAADMSEFGSLKRKISGQEFKDMVRKGWG